MKIHNKRIFQNLTQSFRIMRLISSLKYLKISYQQYLGTHQKQYEFQLVDQHVLYKLISQILRNNFWECKKKMSNDNKIVYQNKQFRIMGLIADHAYSILKVRTIQHPSKGKITFIKLRNPWNGMENGLMIAHHELKKQNNNKNIKAEDGIFYISYQDFINYFRNVFVGYFQKNYIQILSHHKQIQQIYLFHFQHKERRLILFQYTLKIRKTFQRQIQKLIIFFYKNDTCFQDQQRLCF